MEASGSITYIESSHEESLIQTDTLILRFSQPYMMELTEAAVRKLFLKVGVLKKFTIFTRKHLCLSLLLIRF